MGKWWYWGASTNRIKVRMICNQGKKWKKNIWKLYNSSLTLKWENGNFDCNSVGQNRLKVRFSLYYKNTILRAHTQFGSETALARHSLWPGNNLARNNFGPENTLVRKYFGPGNNFSLQTSAQGPNFQKCHFSLFLAFHRLRGCLRVK